MGTAWSWVNQVLHDPDEPMTIMCMGFDGAGKSTLAKHLSLQLGGIETVREHYRRRRKEDKLAQSGGVPAAPRRRVPPALRLRALSASDGAIPGTAAAPLPIRRLQLPGLPGAHGSSQHAAGTASVPEVRSPADGSPLADPGHAPTLDAQMEYLRDSFTSHPATPKLLRRRCMSDIKTPSGGVMEGDIEMSTAAVHSGIGPDPCFDEHSVAAAASTAMGAAVALPPVPAAARTTSLVTGSERNSPVMSLPAPNAVSALPALVTTPDLFAAPSALHSGNTSLIVSRGVESGSGDSEVSSGVHPIPYGLPAALDPATIRLPALVPKFQPPSPLEGPQSDADDEEEEDTSSSDNDARGAGDALIPAAGFNVDQFDIDRTAVEFWDLNGNALHRQAWVDYFEVGVGGVVYVIDGTAEEAAIAQSLDALFDTLDADEVTKPTVAGPAAKDSPLLILVNKCDIETRPYLSATDIAQRFQLAERIESLVRAKRGLPDVVREANAEPLPPPTSRVVNGAAAIGATPIQGHPGPLCARWAIFDCSASKGHNVDVALRWLVATMTS